MSKTAFAKPGNFLYPVPAVMVSCQEEGGKPNIITIAWAGTVCSDPPMVSISVRKSRYSYDLIRNSGEFVINLTTADLVRAADYCGVRSGRDVDKFAECHLTAAPSTKVQAPSIEEAPVSIECKVRDRVSLGSHDMFLAEVLAVTVDEKLLDENGRFHMEEADLAAYSHGTYFRLGEAMGTFGYSVRKKPVKADSKKGKKKITDSEKADSKTDRKRRVKAAKTKRDAFPNPEKKKSGKRNTVRHSEKIKVKTVNSNKPDKKRPNRRKNLKSSEK
ncbi:MAG: flavin reductase family protein [Eubacteriales bacterium]|nr:flavin reductase family protein [Eubacteriales bacterium]